MKEEKGADTESGTSRETCARHVRQAISPASLKLESYKLAWANPCPNPDHTPICSQIGKEMPEKSLVNWKFSNFLSFPSLCHIQPFSAIFCPKEDSPRQLSHVGCILLYMSLTWEHKTKSVSLVPSAVPEVDITLIVATHVKKAPKD